MIRRLRLWFVCRKMDRMLNEIGWPTKAARSIFSGNVTVTSTVYRDQ